MNSTLRLLITCLFLLHASWCHAHPPGLSSVELKLDENRLTAKITFSMGDIEAFAPMDSDLDAEVSDTEREAAKPLIANLLAEQFVVSADHSPIKPQLQGSVNYDEQNNTHIELQFIVPPHHDLSAQSKLLARLPENHQQFVSLIDASGRLLTEKMLVRADDLIMFDSGDEITSNNNSSTFGDFFKLGVEHIVTGYDHLLFLFALLAVTHSFWPAIKIITFFTIAHSITLAMASLDVINLPNSFVEPFIAATIVYVAVENILRGDNPKGRHWLTFSFGLIHGFGFASVLRDLDITSGNTGIVFPLLSFNLGIESGQIAVATIVLPIIWQLNNRLQTAALFLRGCSVVVALIGCYWFLERTFLA